MVMGLAKAVLCLALCLNLTRAYQQQRHSSGRNDLYPKYHVTARPLSSENKLRHSRFPKFGEVMTRMENIKDQPVATTYKSTYNKKIRHKWGANYKTWTTTTTTTTPEPLFDELTYGEYEDEENDRSDYEDEYEDEDEDEDDDEFDDEEYELFDKVEDDTQSEDDMQAEEPTERSTTISTKPMSISEFKWNNYGTRSKVEQSRQQYFQQSAEQTKMDAFLAHYQRAKKQSRCQHPLPKVIPVKREHPHLKKKYIPSCTVLHRCSEDTGCCDKNSKCQYKSRILIQLYFYVQEGADLSNNVEKLEFYNHTECECRTSADELPEDPAPDFMFKPSRQFNTPQTVKRCKCPALFEDARYSNKCACDCAPGNEDCLRLKKGKEHFNLIDRMCIQEGRCGVPICEHGIYTMGVGKCPTKKEKLDEYSRVQLNYG